MKGLVDKSLGIVTRITESLARIKPTEPLRLDKRETRRNETVPIPQVILRSKYWFFCLLLIEKARVKGKT
jgi:hypothetical protein